MCRMNPLGLACERFLVAEDEAGDLLGFGQIEAKTDTDGSEYREFRSLFVKEDARLDSSNAANTVRVSSTACRVAC